LIPRGYRQRSFIKGGHGTGGAQVCLETIGEHFVDDGERPPLEVGQSKGHSRNIKGTFREHAGNIRGTFMEHAGNIKGTFRSS
jgi:hypothetical protein